MKRVLRVMAVVILMALALAGCQILPSSGGNDNSGSAESGTAADDSDTPLITDVLAYFGRTDNPLPSYAGDNPEAPFADLKDSDIVSVEALCPQVASDELTSEEQQAFVEALRNMTMLVREKSSVVNDAGYPTYGMSLHGGALWFDVGFADGSTWLMHLNLAGGSYALDYPGSAVLRAGGHEYLVFAETYNALDELFSASEQRMKEAAPSEAKPFADLTREDVVSADYNSDCYWVAIDGEKIDELVSVLRDITVNPTTANNWLSSDLYGGSPEKIRIVCSDGSSHIVGTWAGVFIDGFVYQGTVEGLSDFRTRVGS